ncbi:MAG: PEP-CTERM sorting domain-containing protein [Verrucomicrobiae bacterium]|nr:PEP-CTERM sorting domain-containing protein [Verrucomicrobiae bacterium]
MKDLTKAARAACLVTGLVSTWDLSADAQTTFNGAITPTHDLASVYFLFAGGMCAAPYARKIADFIPGNTTTSFSVTFNSITPTSNVGNYFAILGVYDTVNGGVSLGFDPTEAAAILGQSPAPDFNGPWVYNTEAAAGTEASIAAELQSGIHNGASIDDAANVYGLVDPNQGLSMYFWETPGAGADGAYFSQISTDPANPATFTLLNFSGASAGGGGSVVEVVPEPGTLSLLAAGGLLFSARYFRRPAAGKKRMN